MPPSKRQFIGWLISWSVIFILMLYVAYCLSGLFVVDGINIDNVTSAALELLKHPFRESYYNEKTPYFLLVSGFVWFLIALWNYAGLHDLRIGEEHGTSKWGSIKKINKQLASFRTCLFLCIPIKRRNDSNNRIISDRIRISYDSRKTLLNNNMMVIGGSGSGKTAFFIMPNLLNCYGSNVYTDPKGQLIEETGNYLKGMGRRVLSLNLVDMEKSCKYNPFRYIRKPSDVNKLVTNLIANTTPSNASHSDPFWEKAEKMYISAIFLYVWMECPKNDRITLGEGSTKEVYLDRSFRSVLRLLDEAQVSTDPKQKSPLDIRMNRLAGLKGEAHPAVKSYRRCIKGAGDTVRSIIISANARFDPFDSEDLLRILDGDDIDLPSLAIGIHGDMETKTSLFCCIPDDDDTYNFIPGLLYTQLFQELYRQARFYGGKCPIPVGVWLDEYANTKMPNAFEKILATCRSREIYCSIFLQSLAQLKSEYKDERWEGIMSNCDTIVFLGGNEPSSQKHMSEQVGEKTIEKKSQSESKGGSGGYSSSFDVMGRKLLTTDEVNRLKDRCICLIRGEYPLMDKKWNYYRKYKKVRRMVNSYGVYEHENENNEKLTYTPIQPDKSAFVSLKENSLKYYEKCRKRNENVKIYQMAPEDFLFCDFSAKEVVGREQEMLEELQKQYKEQVAKGEVGKAENVGEGEKSNAAETPTYPVSMTKKSLIELVISGSITIEQLEILKRGADAGISMDRLLTVISGGMSPTNLETIIRMMERK